MTQYRATPKLFTSFTPPRRPITMASTTNYMVQSVIRRPTTDFPTPRFLHYTKSRRFTTAFPRSTSTTRCNFTTQLVHSNITTDSTLLTSISPADSLLRLPITVSIRGPPVPLETTTNIIRFTISAKWFTSCTQRSTLMVRIIN